MAPVINGLTDAQSAGARFGAAIRNLSTEFTGFGRNMLALDTPLGRFTTSLRNIALVAAGIGAAKGLSNFIQFSRRGRKRDRRLREKRRPLRERIFQIKIGRSSSWD